MLKKLAVIALAVVASAAPALAGTKYAVNLVTNDPVDPPSPPDLSPKSSLKLDDKGKLQASLAGVVEAGPQECVGGSNDGAACTNVTECPLGTCSVTALPVTTSGVYNDSFLPTVDATTYVVIIKMVIPGISGFIPVVELPVPVDLNKGKGKTKLSAKPLFDFIPGGLGRSLEIIGVEVWGPLGGQAAACQAVISQAIPASLTSPDPACRGGSKIGMSGLAIPPPPAP